MGITVQAYRIAIGTYTQRPGVTRDVCGCYSANPLAGLSYISDARVKNVRFNEIRTGKKKSDVYIWYEQYCVNTCCIYFARYWTIRIYINLLLQCGDVEKNPGPIPGCELFTDTAVKGASNKARRPIDEPVTRMVGTELNHEQLSIHNQPTSCDQVSCADNMNMPTPQKSQTLSMKRGPSTNLILVPSKKTRRPIVKDHECSKCLKKYVRSSLTVDTDSSADCVQYICKKCANPRPKENVFCTVCHKIFERNSQIVRFNLKSYNFDVPTVAEYLNSAFRLIVNGTEYICRTCMYHMNKHKYHSKPRTTNFAPCKVCRMGSICTTKQDNGDLIEVKESAKYKLPELPIPPKPLLTNQGQQSSTESPRCHSFPTWLEIMGEFACKRSYLELERYVISLLHDMPNVSIPVGNKYLPSYNFDSIAYQHLPADRLLVNPFPVITRGDGNCFFNALSLAVYGDEHHSVEMRVRTVIEAVSNIELYLSHDYLSRGYNGGRDNLVMDYCDYSRNGAHSLPTNKAEERIIYMNEVFDVRLSGNWCGIWQFHQAAGVLKQTIHSVHPMIPNVNLQHLRDNLNRFILPQTISEPDNGNVITIMWTPMTGRSSQCNHFVLVVDHPLSDIDISLLNNYQYIPCDVDMDTIDLTLEKTTINCENQHTSDVTLTQILNPIHDGSSEAAVQPNNLSVGMETTQLHTCDVSIPSTKVQHTELGQDSASKTFDWLCTCCHVAKSKGQKRVFNLCDYNLENDSVKHALDNRLTNKEKEYICVTCRDRLRKYSTGGQRPIPKNHNVDWLCLCCHLTKTTRQKRVFVSDDYDLENDIVKHAFHGKLNHANKQYICVTCRDSLWKNRTCPPTTPPVKQIDDLWKCTCCHVNKAVRYKRLFKLCDYDFENEIVKQAFKDRVTSAGKEYICLSCQNSLCKLRSEIPLTPSVPQTICTICHLNKGTKHHRVFRLNDYDLANDVVQLAFKKRLTNVAKEYICRSCRDDLMGTYRGLPTLPPLETSHDDWSCTCCHRTKSSSQIRVFNLSDYDWENEIVNKALAGRLKNVGVEYICKWCQDHLWKKRIGSPVMPPIDNTKPKHDWICMCCHLHRATVHKCEFILSDYNMDNEIVKGVFENRLADEDCQYICTYCRDCLWKNRVGSPISPHHAWAVSNNPTKNTKARKAFRKCCKQFPQYVCTVCHRCLFQKTVKQFSPERFDTTNIVVQQCFEHRLKVGDGTEFICLTCNNDLKSTDGPKMPAQAIANGLLRDVQPPELKDLTRMERRCIAGRIPFMYIQSLKKGGQKKITGPCINVPASMEPMCQLLPRVPDDLKLVLVKLKRKLSYKSYYLCDYIRPDVVMKALLYLKAHNPYYKDVQVNHEWYREFENSASDYTSLTSIAEESDSELREDIVQSNKTPDFSAVTTMQEPSDLNVTDSHQVDQKPDEVNSDDDFEEVQSAADRTAAITPDPLPTCIQKDNVDELIFSIAPGENAVPKLAICDPDVEVLGWPDKFPHGAGVFHTTEPRTRKLDMRRYVNQRLLEFGGTMARDYDWCFAMQHTIEMGQLHGAASLALRTKRASCMDGSALTAGMLRTPTVLTEMFKQDHAYQFMKQVRGTPAYWQQRMYDSLALMKKLGKPTWFLTLSPAEFLWVEMVQACALNEGKTLTDDEALSLSWGEKAELFRNNPVIVVQIFSHRLDSFFKEYLQSDACPLGKVADFFWKIEFQARGSPHAHCLIWIEGAPVIGRDKDEDVINFIDQHCTGEIPDDECDCNGEVPADIKYGLVAGLARRLQNHVHSPYCRSSKKAKCRFGFGKAPSPYTLISRPPTDDEIGDIDEKKNALILRNVREEVEEDNSRSLKDILAKCKILESDYVKALRVSTSGPAIILKREPKDTYINNFNYNISSLWGANMDVQYVVDEYSAIMYVCSYVMKSEKGMSELIKQICREFASDGVETQIKKITQEWSGKREVSLPEALMRVLSMRLYHKSRVVRFVSSSQCQFRSCVPKKKEELALLAESSEDIFMLTIHDRYVARPDELENMCLAQFATQYDVITEKQYQANGKGVLPRIKLKNDQGYMRKRKIDAVLRTNKQKKDTDKYYYGKLLLFLPYRSEIEFGLNHPSVMDHYISMKSTIADNSKAFNEHEEDVEKAFEKYEKSTSGWDAAAIGVETDETAGGSYNVPGETSTRDASIPSALSLKYRTEARKGIMSNYDYYKGMRSLTFEQRQMVMYNRACCKNRISEMKAGHSPDANYTVLSGSGGTGKSHVIHLIHRDVVSLYSNTNTIDPKDCLSTSRNPNKPTSLLTATTGTAAFNIGGSTIHSTFQLQAKTLPDEKKSVMQTQLHQLEHVIVDECSMFGLELLNSTNERCSLVKREDSSLQNFGRISILAVGDFYQLPPVMQTPMYKRPLRMKSLSDMAPLIWHKFKFHELTQIMRQKDVEFAMLLNEVRTRVPVENDHIDNKLRLRELTVGEDHPDYPHTVLHVYARNDAARVRNEKMLNKLDSRLYVSKARDSGGNNVTLKLSDKATDTGNLQELFLVKVGARVILTNNIDVTDGLTNGAYGTVHGIIPNIDNADVIHAILVKFDSDKCGVSASANSIYKVDYPGCVPIMRVDVTFPATQYQKTIMATRNQFPMFLAWAVTIHKVQGMTLQEIVVDMTWSKGIFNFGQAYVALSRVTSYEKLHIIGYNRRQFKVNPDVNLEMERLRSVPITPPPPSPILNMHAAFRIGHLNVQGGLKGKIIDKCEDIRVDVDLQCLDVVCLTETHLSIHSRIGESDISSKHKYGINRRDRVSDGGGVLMAIKNCHIHHEINMDGYPLEIVCSAIQPVTSMERIYIFCVYIPPKQNKENAAMTLRSVLNPYTTNRCVVLGDINEDLMKKEERSNIYTTLSKLGFVQHIAGPTTDHASLLDHMYTLGFSNVSVDVQDCYYSDHDKTLCAIHIN